MDKPFIMFFFFCFVVGCCDAFTGASSPGLAEPREPQEPGVSPGLPAVQSTSVSDGTGVGLGYPSSTLNTSPVGNAQHATDPSKASMLSGTRPAHGAGPIPRGAQTIGHHTTATSREPGQETVLTEESRSANAEQNKTRAEATGPERNGTSSSSVLPSDQDTSKRKTPTTSAGERPPPNKVVFVRRQVISANDMNRCFVSNGRLVRRARNVEIFANYTPVVVEDLWVKLKDSQLECNVEMIVPLGKAIKMQVVHFNSTCDNIRRLLVVETRLLHMLLDSCKDSSVAGEFSVSERVTVRLVVGRYVDTRYRWTNFKHFFVLHMILTEVPLVKDLKVSYADRHRGTVQTPRWDGFVHYPPSMSSKVEIDIPVAHTAMLSYQRLQVFNRMDLTCPGDYLQLHVYRQRGVALGVQLLPRYCGDWRPPAEAFHAVALHFIFVSNARDQAPGFRAHFSFHAEATSPERASEGGKWNCSVPYWSEFRFHFPCNLESECAGSEDEESCDYTTDVCGTGLITVGDGCYLLVGVQEKINQHEPVEGCEARGGKLASLNTRHELQGVWKMLHRGTWRRLIVGLELQPLVPDMYRDQYLWADGSVAYYLTMLGRRRGDACFTIFYFESANPILNVFCGLFFNTHYLCELPGKLSLSFPKTVRLSKPTRYLPMNHHVRCPSGHLTHAFLACDVNSDCWRADDTAEAASSSAPFYCRAPVASLPPHFRCEDNVGYVPYSLLCDHIEDCPDGSDEKFCVFPPCVHGFQCRNQQCVPAATLCDGQERCLDGSHKDACQWTSNGKHASFPPPNLVDMNQHGQLRVVNDPRSVLTSASGAVACPETYFECPATENYYCLPLYLRCNGVFDCPRHEDEADCSDYACVGFYRCRGSRVCLHPDHVCDGYFQCPQHDDEVWCHLQCPVGCTCHGVALECTAQIAAGTLPGLTYLDARGTGMTFDSVKDNKMLVYLSLAGCRLTRVPHAEFPNLKKLDLSDNLIAALNVTFLAGLPALRFLALSGNPLAKFQASSSRDKFGSLQTLDLSRCALRSLEITNLTAFPNLRVLNVTGSGVDVVSEEGFRAFTKLRTLDLRGCAMSVFPRTILQGLGDLRRVYADNFKMCCPATLPVGFPLSQCHAPSDEISSCDTLLRSDFFRLFLYLFAVMALVGNASSFVYRAFVNRSSCNQGFGVFVTNLCVSDFLMGMYLTTIGVADRLYLGAYLWEDVRWRNSVACKMSGFLSLLSCEVSALVICLITLDRFLVLRFPFSRVRFSRTSGRAACVLVWLIGLVIAVLPLLPPTARWEFYKQSSICIPLPVTRRYFAGFGYSFGVMIVLNSVLFVLIAAGQASIYHSIRINSISMADVSKSSSKDLTIARRLITIAMSDFLCWFPIGFLGVLASQNIPIPGQVNVAIAIFVLPLNSALNPFLYTLNVVKERRQRAQFLRLKALFQSQAQLKAAPIAANEAHG